MQWLSVLSPATYTLQGARRAILDGASVSAVWDDLWPLILIGVVAVPLGLYVFSLGERYAKRHGRLKRSG
jgi:ABC-2 type transport system permease protein